MKLKEKHTLLPQDLTEVDRQVIMVYMLGLVVRTPTVTDAWKHNCLDLIISANETIDAAIAKMMEGK